MGPITSFAARLTCRLLPLAFTALALPGLIADAQVVIAPPPTVGSANPVSPEPAISRPTTTPCKVPLFQNATFNNFNNQSFPYAPPAACPGPWAKVVFTADFTVSSGRQYDRSAEIFIGNATLFRGTTAEPSSALSPSWHVESDATDLSALLNSSQTVVANIGNLVNSTYTGIIYANAELDFYPSDLTANLAPTVPDQVIPLVQDTTNPFQAFAGGTSLTVQFNSTNGTTLPKNMTQIYLDVIAQPDEFWWLSTPNAQVAPYIQNVNQTALREIDVTIDGKPAGVAPNHPYVFTGGIDPYLWRPIPAAQTLHLRPYRINLTPFAGALSDGNAHTIVLTDINVPSSSNTYLSADLFVYTDHGGATTTGAVGTNTLTVNPGTTVNSSVNLDGSGNGNATVSESLQRSFTIAGYVNTSGGKIVTSLAETVNFSNSQELTNNSTENVVLDSLTSTVDSTVTTTTPNVQTTASYHTENPLQAFISYNQNTDGTSTQTTTATVGDVNNQVGPGTFSSNESESVMATDSLQFNASGSLTGNTGAASTGTFQSNDSLGNHYSSTLNSLNNVLTGAITNAGSTGSTVFVTASATTVPQGTSVTLTATVQPLNSATVPTGRITFYSNGNELSIVSLTNGVATVTFPFTHVGANVITATYSGDGNFIPETSMNPLTVTVTAVAGTFTLGPASPATTSVKSGASAIVSVPVTAGPSFTGTVALSCSGAPTGATCVVNPASVTLAASTTGQPSTQTVSVVVTTQAFVAANHVPLFGGSTAGTLGGISMASVLLMLLPRRRSKSWSSMALTALAVCGLGLCSVGMLTGCGSGSTKAPPQSGTPTGTYTITVTGTSGTVTASTTFTVNVN